MAHPYHHALSSVDKWGGVVEDYLPIHSWFDESKQHMGDIRHRMYRHHTQGIFEAEQKFGIVIRIFSGRKIPVRWIGEQHIMEDIGRIPTLSDWLDEMPLLSWMGKSGKRLSKEYLNKELKENKEIYESR
jgi:hypothetical protein